MNTKIKEKTVGFLIVSLTLGKPNQSWPSPEFSHQIFSWPSLDQMMVTHQNLAGDFHLARFKQVEGITQK